MPHELLGIDTGGNPWIAPGFAALCWQQASADRARRIRAMKVLFPVVEV